MSVSLNVPGQAEIAMTIGSMTFAGTCDTALGAMLVHPSDMTGLALTESITDPSGPVVNVSYSIDAFRLDGKAGAGATGGVGGTMTYPMTGLREDISVVGGPDQPVPMNLTVTAARATFYTRFSGLENATLRDLLAWVAAHPDTAAMTGDQAGLKARPSTILPVFASINSDMDAEGISVETPFDPVAFAHLSGTIAAWGVVADGMFSQRFTAEGIALPAGMVPDWAAAVVPAGAVQIFQDPMVAGTNDIQELSRTRDAVSRAKTEPWHPLPGRRMQAFAERGILTRQLPLRFPEADRFHRRSRTGRFLACSRCSRRPM